MNTSEPHIEFIWLTLPIVEDDTTEINEDTPRSKLFVRADQIVAIEQNPSVERLCRVTLKYDDTADVPETAETVVGWLTQGMRSARQLVEKTEMTAAEPPKSDAADG